MKATAVAIDHWQRLGSDEQARFRALIEKANGDAGKNLAREEYKELRRTWKKLDVAGVVKSMARGRPTGK